MLLWQADQQNAIVYMLDFDAKSNNIDNTL